MSNKKTLLSLAVASALGVVSVQASAAAPTIYGDLAIALVYTGSTTDATGVAGSESSYQVFDNVSLLGVKGEVAKIGTTSYFYDFNFILNQTLKDNTGYTVVGSSPVTHLAIVGMDGDFGTVTLGKRDNGLFLSMVDGGTYQQNWFYTPGMSSFQVSDAVSYKSKSMSGFQFGLQAFDIGKAGTGTNDTTTNYTVAGTYGMGAFTFAAGYTKYADLGGAASSDANQFGDAQNVWSGTVLDTTKGVSVAYKADKWNAIAAYDIRSPLASGVDDLKTLMVTGAYSVTEKTTVAANYSSTSGSKKGNIVTLIASYAPTSALYYSVEYATSDSDANNDGITGATSGYNFLTSANKSSSSIAVGVTYNF